MDEKKVREAIEAIKANYPTSGYYMLREGLDTAIEALEKQLPKKPKEEKGAYTHKIGEFRIGKCPKCEVEVSDRFGVCLDCGQCLDWSWEKE